MVPGFNHNVKRRGKAYHVQTEDLGLSNPVVVTHLFAAGNVVASCRTSYADIMEATDRERRVRELMEEQHKQMLRNLVNGAYDSEVPARPVVPVTESSGPAAASPPLASAAAPRPAAAVPRAALGHGIDDGLEQAILAYLAGEPEA